MKCRNKKANGCTKCYGVEPWPNNKGRCPEGAGSGVGSG